MSCQNLIAGPKPMRTEFGILLRLESCASGSSIEGKQKGLFAAILTNKVDYQYAISHKINNREKRSSPWPLVIP